MATKQDVVDFPDLLSNDELSANLIKCAMLVKKGEKDPLIRQTIHDLTFYLTGKRVSGHQSSNSNSTNAGHSSAVPTPAPHHQSSPRSTSQVLSRHQVHGSATAALGGVLGKMVGLHPNNSNEDTSSVRSESQKAATSAKNAERVKAELRGHGFAQTASQDWCDVHFTMGCHCKNNNNNSHNNIKKPTPTATASARVVTASSGPPSKPQFQRPSNPSSALIANGWIEQQRRSKMRVVWKEVLASLVEGRKPGEETTLWIQREIRHPITGKPELEALHQIPVKWLQTVSFFTDKRFILKVYNLQEEFVFRCDRSEEAAQNWVLTLRSIQDIERKKSEKKKVSTGIDDWEHEPVERSSFEDEKKAPDHAANTMKHPPPASGVAHATPEAAQAIAQHAAAMAAAQKLQQQAAASAATASAHHQPPTATAGHQSTVHRMSVKELRAIAHGAGVLTHGMERSDLERVVQQIANLSGLGSSSSTGAAPQAPPPPPPSSGSASSSPIPPVHAVSVEEETRRKQAEEKQRLQEEAVRRQKLLEEAARARAAAEAQKKADEDKRKAATEEQQRLQQEAEKKAKEEEERQRAEAERRRREEEEHQRRVAEMQAAEHRRRQEEQQRQQQAQWQQQQQNWQKQQMEAEQRRMAEEQRMAEERRRQEEAFRTLHQQQPWPPQQQQPQQHPVNGGAPPQWHQHQPPHNPHGQYGHPQQPPFPAPGQMPRGHTPPPPPPPPPPGSSPVNMKYAKMAAQTGDGGPTSLQNVKHGILVEWALQPPNMQTLRPIEVLITSIQAVFPPRFGVPAHEHFKKWTIVTMPEVLSGTQPDAEKLSKVVRKLRFVLHPDKLPRDFSEDQMFMCKMLWDIISDAFEDHKKREEELGWMR